MRPARPDDAIDLAAIDCLVNASPWTLAQFEGACRSGPDASEQALVLDGATRPLGFVVFSRVLEEGCIHNIAVHPYEQGRGFGTSLLIAALAELKQAGATRCGLELRATNTAARALYGKLSFQVDGVRRNYYPATGGREDAVLMSKQL